MLLSTTSLDTISLSSGSPSCTAEESCAAALTLIDTLPSLMGIMGNETETASWLFAVTTMTADFWPDGTLVQKSLLSSNLILT